MAKEKVKCPDCDGMFFPPGLGPHRARMHGAKAKPAIILRGSQHPNLKGEFPCPECSFVAKWTGGLKNHMRTHLKKRSESLERPAKTEIVKTRRVNGASEEGHFAANGIPEATLALALGRFQGFCTSMAAEFDLPPRLFASRLAELIYRSQVR